MELVTEAINEKLHADGYNINFEFIFIPWDVWQQKTNIMMSTGEEFELIHVMEDTIPSSTYVNMGGIIPLDDLIDEYGPNLKTAIDDFVWDACRVRGQIYSIPVEYRDFSAMQWPSIQKQYLDKYNLEMPTNEEELIQVVKTVMEGENDPTLKLWMYVNSNTGELNHRSSERWPFMVIDALVGVDQSGEVFAWLESEEFKKDCDFLHELYEIGYVPDDILSIPHETVGAHIAAGDWIFLSSSAQFSSESLQIEKPEIDLVDFTFCPEKTNFYGQWIYMNVNAVSASSPNPEAGVMFFDWLYSSQENYDLVNYGIEDVHWKDLGDRQYEVIPGEDGVNADYGFGDWEIGNYKLVRATPGMSEGQKAMMFGFDAEAEQSVITGFKFDPEPVSAEYAAVVAELEASVYPIKYGVVSYDEGYEYMMSSMNAAGYQEVVAEFQRQIAEYMAAEK